MKTQLELLDIVALLIDVPEKYLVKGQVGTIVELHKNNFYEVEFCNNDGETIAMLAIEDKNLLHLHYDLRKAG